MLKRKTSVIENYDSQDPENFLNQLPTNKQIRNYLISHYSPLKNKSKAQSSNDLNAERDIRLEDIIQYKMREKQKNLALNQIHQVELNHHLDILNSQKCNRKVSEQSLQLPQISRKNNLEAYYNDDQQFFMKKKEQRAVSFSSKNESQSGIKQNKLQNKLNESYSQSRYDAYESIENVNQRSTNNISLPNRSPQRQRRHLNDQEYQNELSRQSKLVVRKLELDEQLELQVEKLKLRMQQERSLDKIQQETYVKENQDNEDRKFKLKKLKQSTQSIIKEQIIEKMQKNKDFCEKEKKDITQQSQSKKDEERKNSQQLIQKKQALQKHYKELAKQILTQQNSSRDSMQKNSTNQESFQDKICKQDECRVKNRQDSLKKVQGFIKGQQREQKQQIFMEFKNMYDYV